MRSPRTASVAGMIVGLLAITASGVVAQEGATITVAQDGSGDHDTISAAVEAATAGDTVLIAPGTYNELTIILDEDLRLVGDGDRSEIVVSPSAELVAEAADSRLSQEPPPAVIRVTAGAPSIERLTLQGGGRSLVVEGGSPTFTDVVFEGGDVELILGEPVFRESLIGVYFAVRGASPTVEDSELTGHASVDGPGRTIIRRSTLHDGTSASANATGVYEDNHFVGVQLAVDTGSDMLVRGNLVEGVDAIPAIEVRNPGSSAENIGNTIRDSVIGITVDSDEPGSSVVGNTIEGVRIGIYVDSDSPVPVADNAIDSTTAGIVLGGDGPEISGNTICGEGTAFDIRNGSPSIGSNEVCEALEP